MRRVCHFDIKEFHRFHIHTIAVLALVFEMQYNEITVVHGRVSCNKLDRRVPIQNLVAVLPLGVLACCTGQRVWP